MKRCGLLIGMLLLSCGNSAVEKDPRLRAGEQALEDLNRRYRTEFLPVVQDVFVDSDSLNRAFEQLSKWARDAQAVAVELRESGVLNTHSYGAFVNRINAVVARANQMKSLGTALDFIERTNAPIVGTDLELEMLGLAYELVEAEVDMGREPENYLSTVAMDLQYRMVTHSEWARHPDPRVRWSHARMALKEALYHRDVTENWSLAIGAYEAYFKVAYGLQQVYDDDLCAHIADYRRLLDGKIVPAFGPELEAWAESAVAAFRANGAPAAPAYLAEEVARYQKEMILVINKNLSGLGDLSQNSGATVPPAGM